MSRNIEIEFKNLITETEFHLLLKTFNITNKDFFTQVNHYFDTKEFELKQLNSALRIREISGSYELTLKKPAKEGLLEINDRLNKNEAQQFLNEIIIPEGEVGNELKKLNIKIEELTLLGSLRTDRAEVKYKEGLLVLDHSFYNDQEDYEVEYEVANYEQGKEDFFLLLDQLKIVKQKTDNKIKRLFTAMNERNK